MGLAKHGRWIVCLGLVVAVSFACAACSKTKKTSVSSNAFLAPQLAPSGTNAIEVAVPRLELVRAARVTPPATALDSDLAAMAARVTYVSPIDENRTLVYENVSKTLLSVSEDSGKVVKAADVSELLINVTRPVIALAVQLDSGWILLYESQSMHLLGLKPDPTDDTKFSSEIVLTPSELKTGLFTTAGGNVRPGPQVTAVQIQSMMKFNAPTPDGKDHLMIVPANASLSEYDHIAFQATEDGHLLAEFPDPKPFLDFAVQVSPVTQTSKSDVKDMPPVAIPGTNDILMFDQRSTSLLLLRVKSGVDAQGNPAIVTSVDLAAQRSEFLNAIAEANKGGEPFDGTLTFNWAFQVPSTTRVLMYDTTTQSIFAYDYAASANPRISMVTTQTMLVNRRDLRFDPELDTNTNPPDPRFSTTTVSDNLIAYEAGAEEVIAVNFFTGQAVTILHKRDITAVTGINTLDVNHITVLDPPPVGKGTLLRVYDAESSNLLSVHLDYTLIPDKAPLSR